MDERDDIPEFFEERDVFGLRKSKSETLNVENVNSHYNPYENIPMPTLARRIKALIIDTSIIIILMIIFSFIFNFFESIIITLRVLLFIFLFYLYEPILVSKYGGTVGHKIMGIKIKLYKDSKKNIGFFRAFFRFYMKTLLGWISFFTITLNKNHRSIHDLVSGSIILFNSTNAVQ